MPWAQRALVLAYPAAVYLALPAVEPRWIALLLLGFLLLRLALTSRERLLAYAITLRLPGLAVGATIAVSAIWNDHTSLLLAPAAISLALLIVFAGSMRAQSIVESFARVQLGVLNTEETRYCRQVTAVWCFFFLINGLVIVYLALAGRTAEWALYTGLLAYLLMGLLFATEFVYRHWRFRRYFGAPTDALLRRIFPPRSP